LPATFSSAATISPTVTVSAGRFIATGGPQASAGTSAARRRPAQAGDAAGGRAQGHRGGRGHRAACAFAGQRLAHDAAEEARRRRIGPARAHRDRHQAHAAPAHQAAAGEVGHQLLADELLDAVAVLRHRQHVVLDDGRRLPPGRRAQHRHRAGEDEHRHLAPRPAALHKRQRGVEVAAQPEVEVGLAFPAHRRREVEHGVGLGQRQRAGTKLIDEIATKEGDARVGGHVGRRGHPIRQPQPLERARGRPGQLRKRLGEQAARQAQAQEAAASGDEDLHA
jgi:hypothetical protein